MLKVTFVTSLFKLTVSREGSSPVNDSVLSGARNTGFQSTLMPPVTGA